MITNMYSVVQKDVITKGVTISFPDKKDAERYRQLLNGSGHGNYIVVPSEIQLFLPEN